MECDTFTSIRMGETSSLIEITSHLSTCSAKIWSFLPWPQLESKGGPSSSVVTSTRLLTGLQLSKGISDRHSQLPLPVKQTEVRQPAETILLMEMLSMSLVTAADIWIKTGRDVTLAKVWRNVIYSWAEKNSDDALRPCWQRR